MQYELDALINGRFTSPVCEKRGMCVCVSYVFIYIIWRLGLAQRRGFSVYYRVNKYVPVMWKMCPGGLNAMLQESYTTFLFLLFHPPVLKKKIAT